MAKVYTQTMYFGQKNKKDINNSKQNPYSNTKSSSENRKCINHRVENEKAFPRNPKCVMMLTPKK